MLEFATHLVCLNRFHDGLALDLTVKIFRIPFPAHIPKSSAHDKYNAIAAKHAQIARCLGDFVFKSTFPPCRRSFFAESGNKIRCLSLLVGDGHRSFVPAFDF
jgi:hypothetical protein